VVMKRPSPPAKMLVKPLIICTSVNRHCFVRRPTRWIVMTTTTLVVVVLLRTVIDAVGKSDETAGRDAESFAIGQLAADQGTTRLEEYIAITC
jgi:hypothetical protein